MMFLDDIFFVLGVDCWVVFWVVFKIMIFLYNYVFFFLIVVICIWGLLCILFFFDVCVGVFLVEFFVVSMVDRILVIMMGGCVVFFVFCFLGR